MSKDGLIPAFDMNTEKCKTCMLTKITKKPFQNIKRKTEVLELIYADLCDSHATPSLGNKKYFVTFIDDASRFCYVYLLHSKDEALDKFKVFKTEVELQQGYLIKRFKTHRRGLSQGFWGEAMAVVRLLDPKLKTLSGRGIECIFVGYLEIPRLLVPRPSQRSLVNGTEDFGGLVVPEEVTEEGFRQKSEIDYFDTYAPVARISTIRLLIVITSIHNLIIHQMDVKTAFLNGELDEEVYMNQPRGFIMLSNENKVDLTNEFLSSRFYMNDMGEDDVILVSTPMGTSEKLMPNNGQAVSQLKYSRMISCLMYAMTCTRPDIAFAVGKLRKYNSNPDNPSTSGWVFMLGGGAISWAFKKQTCITGSIIEYEFVALAAAGKEAESLKNFSLRFHCGPNL
ncbi:zinc finger, CCHC-type containing protein [Tanacetum coccineum]